MLHGSSLILAHADNAMGMGKVFIFVRGMQQSATKYFEGLVQDCGVLTELTPDRLPAIMCTATAVTELAYTSMLWIQCATANTCLS